MKEPFRHFCFDSEYEQSMLTAIHITLSYDLNAKHKRHLQDKRVRARYPSLENAMEALNQGADAYVTKPVKPEKILALIKEKLEEQSQNEKMTENKVTDWIKTRARKLEDVD
jgi:DNA-binding NtrC family response regulator